MFVPSLSWQNDGICSIKQHLKREAFSTWEVLEGDVGRVEVERIEGQLPIIDIHSSSSSSMMGVCTDEERGLRVYKRGVLLSLCLSRACLGKMNVLLI